MEACNVLQDPSFLEISQETLIKIVEQDGLNVPSELQVINACLRWAKNEAHKQNLPCGFSGTRQILGPVFSLLRFLSLTPTQFAEGPAKSDLLTCEEGYSILLHKLSRFNSNQLPEHISQVKTPRKYVFQQFPFYSTVYKDFLKVCSLSDPSDPDSTTVEYLDYYHVEDPDVHIFRFTVDKDILLLGFEIATQSNVNVFKEITNKPTYIENARAVIYVDESDVATATFKGLVHYDRPLFVKFKKPVKISKDIDQEVLLEFCNTGSYKSLKYTSRLKRNSVGNVNFKLDQKDSDGMVYSVIFTSFEQEL